MRKANTNDLFNIVRLINDLDLKEEFFKAQHGEEDAEKIGVSFVFDILGKATTKKAQNMIYGILAEPFEVKTDEVGLMEIDKLVAGVLECFDFKTVANFIKSALHSN